MLGMNTLMLHSWGTAGQALSDGDLGKGSAALKTSVLSRTLVFISGTTGISNWGFEL